ncbi:hypothetical protein BH10PLA2_BH10PLA2_25810 [soil metagenome]
MRAELSSGFTNALKGKSVPRPPQSVGALLVVDDEPAITQSIADQLRRRYRVLTASGAKEAEALWRTEDVSVILSDQRMPGTTGAELLSRSADQHEDTTRLLITGYADIEGVVQAVNEGRIYHYLVKPWLPIDLENVVDKAFEHNRLLRERRKLTEDLQLANVELEAKVKARTQELEEKNRLLEEMGQTKNLFLGMAAHDLRGPSGNIAALAELILDDDMTMTRAERQEMLGLIRGEAQGMLNLLGHLLDISKIEAGKLELHPEPIDLSAYVEETRKRHRLLAEQKRITLTTEVAAGLPKVAFDRERIGQVLGNLLSNAFKFSNSNSAVILQVAAAPGGIEFSIIDQGQGIQAGDVS